MEEWRDIEGYEGLYQVSNLGRIKSFRDNHYNFREKILKLKYHNDGYVYINLCKDHNQKTFRVHKLVAQAFIPNPKKYNEINHKDENKQNNKAENLEWCDREYNNNYGTKKDRFIDTRGTKVRCINTGKIYRSTREASRDTGIDNSFISKCCRGKYKTAGKDKYTGEPLRWEYL